MRDYAIQYNNGVHSCGPIVLLNALRHQGHRVVRRHLPFLARKLKSNGDGIFTHQLSKIGRQMGALHRINSPAGNFKRINAELLRGNGIAIRVGMQSLTDRGTQRYSGHYFFLGGIRVHRGKTSYYVANVGRRCMWRTWEEVRKFYFKRYDRHWYTDAWVVPAKKKKGLRLVG